MALQLGFDGSVKLLDYSRESLLQAAQRGAQTYSTLARSIEPGESEREVYWRITFAILSVHSPIRATFAAYRQVRLAYAIRSRLPGTRRLASLLAGASASDGVILYAGQKARYLHQFDSDWRSDRARFLRGGDTDNDWRLRLRRNVLGLGLAKASFAVALCCPSTADVCCIDTHIYQLLTGKPYRAITSLPQYLALEDRIRKIARKCKLNTFALQWLLWDAKRGVLDPHKSLRRREVSQA